MLPNVPGHDLLHRLGAGSYGEVWLARSPLGVLRAVKIVHRETFSDASPFDREFKGLLAFEPVSRTHSGFVPILQVGRDETAGCFFYVMELADAVPIVGTGNGFQPLTLRWLMKRQDRLPSSECLTIGVAIAEALEALHTAKLVHRDIKPANIIFMGGKPRLADIGLVAHMDDAHSFVGTVGYIPPEGPGSPSADLYSLGKVLYEMAMGRDRETFPSRRPAGKPGRTAGSWRSCRKSSTAFAIPIRPAATRLPLLCSWTCTGSPLVNPCWSCDGVRNAFAGP